MAAMVQTYPQQTSAVTMLQTRPASASGILQASQSQTSQHFGASQQQQQPRGAYYGNQNAAGGTVAYRGTTGPTQPYAFTATPNLNSVPQWAPYNQYGNLRASSSPAVPTMQNFDRGGPVHRSHYRASASMTNLPTTISMGQSMVGARDDSALPTNQRRPTHTPRAQSVYMTGSATPVTITQVTPIKVSPERYRRPAARSTDPALNHQVQPSMTPSGSGMAAVGHLYDPRTMQERPNSLFAQSSGSAVDDMQINHRSAHEEAQRFRRRSMPALDSADYPTPLTPHQLRQPEDAPRLVQLTPPRSAEREQKTYRGVASDNQMHARSGSSDSVISSRSTNSRPSSSANRNANGSAPTGNPAQLSSHLDSNAVSQPDYPKLVAIPPRSSSSDAAKRLANPSPLSKPVNMDADQDVGSDRQALSSPAKQTTEPNPESPAVKQLAAINQKGGKAKSKTSRLRRAFSFGSAAELRKATGQDEPTNDAPTGAPTRLQKEPTADDLYDAEQARIAQKQEEGGIGNSIYAGARIFSGSTDNLSISSTASSASIMIRKMGRGMKKGGRSLVGLFRPKSVIGVPASDAQLPEGSEATVSMITVEAERQRVNVNADPHSRAGGGTGYPRLERNSIDMSQPPSSISERLGSSGTDNSGPRKSIVGGEKERAEVLAAVRKGILKNTSGSSSPSRGPGDGKPPTLELPNIPQSDSPASSSPSTPNDGNHNHKRTGSIAIGNEDYFVTALRLRQDTKSAPGTPQGGVKRNATFSPRIVFHDTWPSGEYDRRGDIATCNRLTPMLAQQIKEEINSFKMEMEVHENSKIYTQFF